MNKKINLDAFMACDELTQLGNEESILLDGMGGCITSCMNPYEECGNCRCHMTNTTCAVANCAVNCN